MERTFKLIGRQSVRNWESDGYPLMAVTFGNGELNIGNKDIEGYGRPSVVFHTSGIFYGRVMDVEPFGASPDESQPNLRLTIDGKPLFANVLVPYRV